MSWARIMAPLAGVETDAAILAAGVALAEPFGAELAAVYAPPDIADIMPWISDGITGGMQAATMETLKVATAAGETTAKAAFDACAYGRKSFLALQSPVHGGLAMEGRLSDVVVFASEAARGQGPLAEAFEQIVVDEQRPVVIARAGLKLGGVAAVAWDGGKEASRAARLAAPFLEKASRVVLIGAPKATSKRFYLEMLQEFYAARGIAAEIRLLSDVTSSKGLLEAAVAAGADLLVAGAFGHTRLREVIFGGATRTFLNSEQPSLFLSH